MSNTLSTDPKAIGLSGRTKDHDAAAIRCDELAKSEPVYDRQGWADRAESHRRTARDIRGENVGTVPLALVQTDLGISYAHANCENPRNDPRLTIPVCACEYTHCYGFAAYDAGNLVSISRADFSIYRKPL